MSILEIILIAVALSIDAFAVSVGKGIATPKIRFSHVAKCAIWFGLFQGLMPLAGYFLGESFAGVVASVDHWLAFGLLAIIGVNMIRESIKKEDGDDEESGADYSLREMFILAVATSIDALATGASMAFAGNVSNIFLACGIIAVVTALFSAVGVLIGKAVGTRFESRAGIFGGVILIAIGIKILLEHLLS